MLRFVALSRVSSREQEREGFSLDIQDEALKIAAESKNGAIVKLFRIAETATRPKNGLHSESFWPTAERMLPALTACCFTKSIELQETTGISMRSKRSRTSTASPSSSSLSRWRTLPLVA